MQIYECDLNEQVINELIRLSEDWAKEDSCYGYRANNVEDIQGNRVFLAEEDGKIIGYLFGHVSSSKNMRSIIPEDTPFFEIMEIYVIAERRSEGIGKKLFEYMEEKVKDEAEYAFLSTATKNYKAILHFYIDVVGMNFWSASLFKKLA